MSHFSDSVAMVFAQIPHIGNPGLSRNFGIFNLVPCTARYIAFMDGDDLYACEDAIDSLVTALEALPAKIAAFGDYDWIGSEGKPLAPPSGLKRSGGKGGWYWRKNRQLTWTNLADGSISVFHLPCLIVRRGAPYLPYRSRGEDVEYYARLFGMSSDDGGENINSVIQVPKLIAHYRRHAASYTRKTTFMRRMRNR